MGLFKKDPNEEFLKNADLKYHAFIYVPILDSKNVPTQKPDGTFYEDYEKLQYMEEQVRPINITMEIEGKTVWNGPPRTTLIKPSESFLSSILLKISMAAVMVEIPITWPIVKMKPLRGSIIIQSQYEAKAKPSYFTIEPRGLGSSSLPTGYSFCRPGVWSVTLDMKNKNWVKSVETSMMKNTTILQRPPLGTTRRARVPPCSAEHIFWTRLVPMISICRRNSTISRTGRNFPLDGRCPIGNSSSTPNPENT